MADRKLPSPRPGPRDFATFAAALLASLGLSRLLGYLRTRAERRAARRAAERQAERAEEIERKRALGHEPSDVRVRGIVLAGAALALTVAAGGFAVALLFGFLAGRADQADAAISPLFDRGQQPPQPREAADLAQQLQQLRATDEARLGSYGRSGDTLHIPIERAIDLLAERGLPARAATPQPGLGEDQAHELESAGGQPDEPTPVPLGQGSGRPAGAQPAPAATAQPVVNQAGDAAAGQRLFAGSGCGGCHVMGGGGAAPSLEGVFGSQVQLEGGQTVTADEAYLRRSILDPQAQVVAGYRPIMPSFRGKLSDQELAQLIAYIRSLGGPGAAGSRP
ncbi:MAG: c-type cytochrome [Kouleothrix sp.]|nr:c-type cytochrome [Kouleothrix sp.]